MKRFILLTIFISLSVAIKASYCYGGIAFYELTVEDNKLYLLETIKDGNKISYISQHKTMVADDIDLSGFQIVDEIPEGFIFMTNHAYYLIYKKCTDKCLIKLYNSHEVSELKGGYFFKVKGAWQFIYKKFGDNGITKENIAIPSDFNIVMRFHNGYDFCFLLSDDNSLYIVNTRTAEVDKTLVSSSGFEIIAQKSNMRYAQLILKTNTTIYTYHSEEKVKLKKIPNLTASETKIFFQENYRENYIYDNDTFYELNQWLRYKDLTPEFNFLNKKEGFLSASFVRAFDVSFYDADSVLWVRSNISLRNGPTATFYPLVGGKYWDKDNSYILYKEKVYKSGYDAAYQMNSMDVTGIDLNNFRRLDRTFHSDGKKVYYHLKEIDWLSPDAKHVYQTDTSSIYRDKNKLIEIDSRLDINSYLSVKEMNDFPKNLTLALASNDYLFIEHQIIPNIADKETIEFLGSTVKIIRQCDHINTPRAKIDFYYFFRDKDNIYYYYSGLKEMKIIHGLEIQDYKADDFEDLKTLESYAFEEPIEND